MNSPIETLIEMLSEGSEQQTNGLKRVFNRIITNELKISFSQNNEDMYMYRIFGEEEIFWVDIGACHPLISSVTAYYSLKGSKGINIDADERSVNILNKIRKRDVNIHTLIGLNNKVNNFYIHTDPSRSTTKQEYLDPKKYDLSQIKKINLKAETLTDVLRNNNCPKKIDLLKIDAEGSEVDVLNSLKFSEYSAKIAIIETTLPYDMSEQYKEVIKDNKSEVINIMNRNGYVEFFFDGINTWFCKNGLKEFYSQKLAIPLNVNDKYVNFITFEIMIKLLVETNLPN